MVISHYIDAYSFGRVHRPLDEVLDEDEGRHYIACSKYFFQLEQYLAFYPRERILVVQTEALATRRPESLSRIFEFLDADPAFTHEGFSRVLYQRGEHRQEEPRRVCGSPSGTARATNAARASSARRARTTHPRVQLGDRKTGGPAGALDRRRQELIAEFRPDVAQLRAFTGEELPGWCL